MKLRDRLLHKLNVGVQLIDDEGIIRFANERYASIMGLARADLVGTRCWELLHPDKPCCDRCETRGSHAVVTSVRGAETWLFVNNSIIEAGLRCMIVEELGPVLGTMDRVNRELRTLERSIEKHQRGESMLVLCCDCRKVRLHDGTWVGLKDVNLALYASGLSHGYCPECALRIVTQIDFKD